MVIELSEEINRSLPISILGRIIKVTAQCAETFNVLRTSNIATYWKIPNLETHPAGNQFFAASSILPERRQHLLFSLLTNI